MNGITLREPKTIKVKLGTKIDAVPAPKKIVLPEDSGAGLAWNAIAPKCDTSQVQNFNKIFYNITGADFNPDVSKWNTRNGQTFNTMFSGCSGSSFNPDVSRWDLSSAEDLSSMFSGCQGAAFNPDVSEWDLTNGPNLYELFYNCKGAAFNPDVSQWDTSNVENMAGVFYGCSGAAFNPDITGWNTEHVQNFSRIFYQTATTHHKVAWVPKSFKATSCASNNKKPFYDSPGAQKMDVYTDATDASSQGWGTPSANYIMHYGTTHDDYLNALAAL